MNILHQPNRAPAFHLYFVRFQQSRPGWRHGQERSLLESDLDSPTLMWVVEGRCFPLQRRKKGLSFAWLNWSAEQIRTQDEKVGAWCHFLLGLDPIQVVHYHCRLSTRLETLSSKPDPAFGWRIVIRLAVSLQSSIRGTKSVIVNFVSHQWLRGIHGINLLSVYIFCGKLRLTFP